MPTRATESAGVGDAARHVADHATAIAKLEVELAVIELKRKVVSLGLGIGMGVGAAVFAVFGLGFLFATIGIALAIVLDPWLAFLIVTALLFGLAGLLGILAIGAVKRGTPPVPEQAIEEAKLTTEALKNGKH